MKAINSENMAIWNFYILALSAFILLLFAEKKAVFNIFLTLGTAISVINLIRLIRFTSLVRFGNLLATGLLIGYVGGGFVSTLGYFYINGTYFKPVNNYLGSYNQAHISTTLAFVLFTCAFLFFVSIAEKPIFSKPGITPPLIGQRVYRIIILGFSLVFAALLTDQMGYMGIVVNEGNGQITALGSLAHLISPIYLPIIVLVFFQEKVVWKRIILILLFLFFISVTVILGRRVLFVAILLILIAFGIGSNKNKYLLLTKKINIFLGVTTLSLFAFFGSKFFYAMRLFHVSVGEKVSLLEQLGGAISLLLSSTSNLSQEYFENIINRPFIISYLATLLASLDHHLPLFGYELANSFLVAIPSLLFPRKFVNLPSAPEVFVHPYFGLPTYDGANTILTAGLDDFGLVGVILYPLLFIGIFYIFLNISKRILPLPIYYMVSFALIYKTLYIEEALAGLLTVSLRNIIILTILCSLLWCIPSTRIGSHKLFKQK